MIKDDFIAIACPICDSFFFESEKDSGGCQIKQICPHCGWKYDLRKINDPDFSEVNGLSLNEYKDWFMLQLINNPNYDYTDATYHKSPHMCPVCGKHKFSDSGSFEVCPSCGWEDDSIMEKEPDKWAGCANDLCLNDFKKRYLELLRRNSRYYYKKDGFFL